MTTTPDTRRETPLLLLNAAVLTAFGTFTHRPATLEEARDLVHRHPWQSAIGHPDTSRLLSRLLAIDCPCERVPVEQTVGQSALVFRLNQRPALGANLGEADLESIGFHFTLIKRLD